MVMAGETGADSASLRKFRQWIGVGRQFASKAKDGVTSFGFPLTPAKLDRRK